MHRPRIPVLAFSVLLLLATQAQETGRHSKPAQNTSKDAAKADTKSQSGPPAVVVEQNPHPKVAEQERKPQESNGAAHPHNWVEWLNAFSTSIIAVFTALLFYGVMHQVRTARDTERAWVIPHPMGDIIPTNVGRPTRLTFLMKNVGHTPAYVIEQDGRATTLEANEFLSSRPYYLDKVLSKHSYPLIPKYQIPLHYEISEAEMIRINNQTVTLWVCGVIYYTDVYRRAHVTRYCFRYYPPGEPVPGFMIEGPEGYNYVT